MSRICAAMSVLQFKDGPSKLHGSDEALWLEGLWRLVDMQNSSNIHRNFQIMHSARPLFPTGIPCVEPIPFLLHSFWQLLFLSSWSVLQVFFKMSLLTFFLWWVKKLLCDGPLQWLGAQQCLFACFLSVKHIKGRVQRPINKTHRVAQKQIRPVRNTCDLHVTI